jgi:hypothetical protein
MHLPPKLSRLQSQLHPILYARSRRLWLTLRSLWTADGTRLTGVPRSCGETDRRAQRLAMVRIVPNPSKRSSAVTSVRSKTSAVAARMRSAGS